MGDGGCLAGPGKPGRIRGGNPRRIGLAGRRLPPPDDRRDPKSWLEVVGWHTPTEAWFAPIVARRSRSPQVNRSSTHRRGSRTSRSAAPPAAARGAVMREARTAPSGRRIRRCALRVGARPSSPSSRGGTAPCTAATATGRARRGRRSAAGSVAAVAAAAGKQREISAGAGAGYTRRGARSSAVRAAGS